MKIILIILVLVLLTGCGIYDLTNFVLPNDEEFTSIILGLDTPQKICNYMEENFEYKLAWTAYSPYQMWILNTKAGDCNDYSTFAIFVSNYHGYEVYQILIYYDNGTSHMLGVFVEGKFTYSDVWVYHPVQVDTFREIVEHHCYISDRKFKSFKVYDYNMGIINRGDKRRK